MKNTTIRYTILMLSIIGSITSCKKAPVVGGTATQSLAGEWWVKLDNGTGAEFGSGYYNLSTYNTAANLPTEMWIDDDNNAKSFWDVKGKVACTINSSGGTFSGTNIANQDYQSTFTISNGIVIPNAATAPGSKDKTDSISFVITFSDDSPIAPHKVSGYKRTGLAQDDH